MNRTKSNVILTIMIAMVVALIPSCGWPPGVSLPGQSTTSQMPNCADNMCGRRAHAYACINLDGSPMGPLGKCADGCATTCNAAEQLAITGLLQQVCLTPDTPGCCNYQVDTDFNNCGGEY